MLHRTLIILIAIVALLISACDSSNTGTQPGPNPITDTTAPVIGAITGVADGGNYDGSVAISAAATDNVAVTGYTLAIDGTQAASSTTGTLNFTWDTTGATDGSHTLLFTARDAAGNTDTETMDVVVDNSGGGGGDTGNVEGTVFMPNGSDPVSEALVFVMDKGGAAVGDPPGEPYHAFDYSAADGTFELTGVPTGTQTFKIQKGAFSKQFDFDVQAGANTLTNDLTTLPAETGGGGTVGEMAVVTGSYDAIQNVLARLGLGDVDASGALVLGTETFTLIDGNNSLADEDYDNFDEFFATETNFDQYRTIFLNCGNHYESDFFADTDAVNAMRAWIEGGGRLYCTDWSYDFCEQLFPEYIDFAGSDEIDGLSTTAEEPDMAEMGADMEQIDATIENTAMLAWLDGLDVVNTDDTVVVSDWLIAWAAMEEVNSQVNIWARGDISYGFPAAEHNRPITVTFHVEDGLVLFSSYHTEAFPQAELTPQDRILQYLVFEVL